MSLNVNSLRMLI